MLDSPDKEERQAADPTSTGTRAQDNGERSQPASESQPGSSDRPLESGESQPGSSDRPLESGGYQPGGEDHPVESSGYRASGEGHPVESSGYHTRSESSAAASGGYPAGSEGSAADSGGCLAGSEGSGGSEGSAADSGGCLAGSEGSGGSESSAAAGGGYRTGSEGEALLHEVVDRAPSEVRPRRQRVRERTYGLTEDALLDEVYEELEKERPRAARRKQLGIRMQPRQWERLELVAAWSGVTVTTMARVLINRGAKAVIDEELRMRQRFGPEAE